MSAAWVEVFKTRFASKILSYRESAPNEPEFVVSADESHEIVAALKNLEGGAFDHLADLTGYDEFPKSPRFHVVVELISMVRKERCRVVVVVQDATRPSAPTISDLWAGANWLERECFDLLGINFNGHPDQRRILLPPSFKGHPLRKDFVVDYRQKFPETVGEVETFDPFGNNIVNVAAKES